MIGRLRGRSSFERLARDGTRVSHPPLWCSWCPSIEGPNIGFALTRSIGNAVTRNRLRRRLRAILQQIDTEAPLPAIDMIIGARRTVSELTFEELDSATRQLMVRIRTSP